MEGQSEEKIRTNKGLIRVYLTFFFMSLATIILSIISSEHKESIALFKNYTSDQITKYTGEFKILKKLPIAETRFVEGLEFLDETHLLMSSGSYGNSHLDVLDIETNPVKTVKSVPIDSIYFGEGVTYL